MFNDLWKNGLLIATLAYISVILLNKLNIVSYTIDSHR